MANHEPELAMKYFLVDKVDSLESGKRITASKCVTLAEEYLSDHFPTFPVLPGDVFVLCSDGLTGHLNDSEIGTIARELPPGDACRLLVHLANLRG